VCLATSADDMLVAAPMISTICSANSSIILCCSCALCWACDARWKDTVVTGDAP
jgi:hypothetical protein